MVGRFILIMAGLAIGSSCRLVVEGGIFPISGVMARRALPRKVIGRFILVVAGLAISGPYCLVVEGGICPVGGIVAQRALT